MLGLKDLCLEQLKALLGQKSDENVAWKNGQHERDFAALHDTRFVSQRQVEGDAVKGAILRHLFFGPRFDEKHFPVLHTGDMIQSRRH